MVEARKVAQDGSLPKSSSTLAAEISDRILRACSTVSRAKQFIALLRSRLAGKGGDGSSSSRAGASLRLSGRQVSVQDVDTAAHVVRKTWLERRARAHVAQSSAVAAKTSNAEFIFHKIILKCEDLRGAARFLTMLKQTVGKANRSGRVFVADDIAQAQTKLKRWFQSYHAAWQQQPARSARRSGSSSGSSGSSGDSSSSDSSGSESDGSSSSSGSSGSGKGGMRSSRWWRRRARGLREDAEDAFYESDDSDLSGEEEVDTEDLGRPVAAKDLMPAPPPPPPAADDGYPTDWAGAPPVGSASFNEFAGRLMRKVGVAAAPLRATLDRRSRCPPLQPHQEAAVFLLHPKSPITRLLVDHPTGSGKTREMIQMLNNYFFDPRPKVPIFPKEPVCRNFYAELLRWPNRYRDFFCCLKPSLVSSLAGGRDWRVARDYLWNVSGLGDEQLRELCREMREVLEMKGWFYMGLMRRAPCANFQKLFPEEHLPAAPLRALRYTSAGGQHTALRDDGLPKSALFKIGFDKTDGNVYSKKIVVMDEVHNLVRSQTQYGEQLTRLRDLLSSAKGAVLAGFTGTPILSEPHEGRILLDIIKGGNTSLCDDGFMSSFPMRPTPLFPRSLPAGIPDAILTPNLRKQFVRKVMLFGEPLQKYDEKRGKGIPDRSLRAYCNVCVHFASLHEGKNGSKARVLKNFQVCAPKLDIIACDIAAEATKALVLVDRRTGMSALLGHLQNLGAKQGFGVATMEEYTAFNSAESNLRGERFRVMVADASTCSEGVSFFGVRRVFLADVPQTPSALVQVVGRAIRMYSHSGLAPEEQSVTTFLYVSGFPRWLRSPLGAWAFRAQKKHQDPHEAVSKARHLLRTLKRVGITEFEDFKDRLDVYGQKEAGVIEDSSLESQGKSAGGAMMTDEVEPVDTDDVPLASLAAGSRPPSSGLGDGKATDNESCADGLEDTKTPIDARTCIGFLESLGLWEEAKLIRNSEQEQSKKNDSRKASRASKGQTSKMPSKKPEGSSVEKHIQRNNLVRALRALYATPSAIDAVERLNLNPLTADELALKALSEKSREFVPALEELRSKAVDRAVLMGLSGSTLHVKKEELSDGESSADDYALTSASSGDEGQTAGQARKQREAPLVLPSGWRVEQVVKGKRRARVFVSPTGAQFRTEAQAKVAVSASRRSDNMARLLKEKYKAKFVAKLEAKEEKLASPTKGGSKLEAKDEKISPMKRGAKPEVVDVKEEDMGSPVKALFKLEVDVVKEESLGSPAAGSAKLQTGAVKKERMSPVKANDGEVEIAKEEHLSPAKVKDDDNDSIKAELFRSLAKDGNIKFEDEGDKSDLYAVMDELASPLKDVVIKLDVDLDLAVSSDLGDNKTPDAKRERPQPTDVAGNIGDGAAAPLAGHRGLGGSLATPEKAPLLTPVSGGASGSRAAFRGDTSRQRADMSPVVPAKHARRSL